MKFVIVSLILFVCQLAFPAQKDELEALLDQPYCQVRIVDSKARNLCDHELRKFNEAQDKEKRDQSQVSFDEEHDDIEIE